MGFVYKQKHVEDGIPAFRVQRVKDNQTYSRNHHKLVQLKCICTVTNTNVLIIDFFDKKVNCENGNPSKLTLLVNLTHVYAKFYLCL